MWSCGSERVSVISVQTLSYGQAAYLAGCRGGADHWDGVDERHAGRGAEVGRDAGAQQHADIPEHGVPCSVKGTVL